LLAGEKRRFLPASTHLSGSRVAPCGFYIKRAFTMKWTHTLAA
jgi:hypothetical protein